MGSPYASPGPGSTLLQTQSGQVTITVSLIPFGSPLRRKAVSAHSPGSWLADPTACGPSTKRRWGRLPFQNGEGPEGSPSPAKLATLDQRTYVSFGAIGAIGADGWPVD